MRRQRSGRCAAFITVRVDVFGRIAAVSLIPVLCLLAAGFPDYPVREAGDYPISTEKAGVVIGVQPVEDPKEQATYFKAILTDRARKGQKLQKILPIFIVMQNKSGGDSFLFDMKSVTYEGSLPQKVSPIYHESVGFSLVTCWGCLRGSNDAQAAAYNIMRKELQSTTLSPGASVHGFLYVLKPIPDTKIHLQVPITRAGTDEIVVLDLVF